VLWRHSGGASYKRALRPICTFDTVEEFWKRWEAYPMPRWVALLPRWLHHAHHPLVLSSNPAPCLALVAPSSSCVLSRAKTLLG